ncbi:ergosterol 28 [Delitschia confertaspora ATCC 74209]|uniref:Ergosterol 28 n=1 Tax=Delitschia confertaspora ATCC 74209 TaxID=1513339 RepID=A0A9P4JL68_9PLEO|nr:ergosterol 28 [Delitschia confertaspora ATCC 74209]
MSSLTSYLPPFEGLLPKWLFLVSIISVANSIQAYTTLHYTQRVYSGTRSTSSSSRSPSESSTANSPVTPLSARTFGTWTLLSSIIRLYAAYNITNPQVYQLALWTYGIAWVHFVSEWCVFGTTRWGAGLAGPVCVSTGSLVWMWYQWGYYVGA